MGVSSVILIALKLAGLASGFVFKGTKGTQIAGLINELGTAAMAEVEKEAARQGKTTVELLREQQTQAQFNETEAQRLLEKFGRPAQL